jgi:hypothetical protein
LGGGVFENGLLRDAHNAAVDNKPELLLNTIERLGSMPNPTAALRLAEAGWASGKGDGEPLEKLGIWFDAYGMAPLGEGFGTRQGPRGGVASEKTSPRRRTLGGIKENGVETKPEGTSQRKIAEASGGGPKPKKEPYSGRYADGQRAYRTNVPTNENNIPLPDTKAVGEHSKLQFDAKDKGRIYSATEFGANGQPVKRIDFAARNGQPVPHSHAWDPDKQKFSKNKDPVGLSTPEE